MKVLTCVTPGSLTYGKAQQPELNAVIPLFALIFHQEYFIIIS